MLLNPYLLERAKKMKKYKNNSDKFQGLIPITTVYNYNMNLQNMKNEGTFEFKTVKIRDKKKIQEKYDKILEDLESNVGFVLDDEVEDTPKQLEEEFVLVDDEKCRRNTCAIE